MCVIMCNVCVCLMCGNVCINLMKICVCNNVCIKCVCVCVCVMCINDCQCTPNNIVCGWRNVCVCDMCCGGDGWVIPACPAHAHCPLLFSAAVAAAHTRAFSAAPRAVARHLTPYRCLACAPARLVTTFTTSHKTHATMPGMPHHHYAWMRCYAWRFLPLPHTTATFSPAILAACKLRYLRPCAFSHCVAFASCIRVPFAPFCMTPVAGSRCYYHTHALRATWDYLCSIPRVGAASPAIPPRLGILTGSAGSGILILASSCGFVIVVSMCDG